MQTINHVKSNFKLDIDELCYALIDDQLSFIECSPKLASFLGFRAHELESKSLQDVSPAFQPNGSTSRQVLDLRLKACKHGLPQSFEWRFVGRDASSSNAIIELIDEDTHYRCDVRVLDQSWHDRQSIRESKLLLQQMLDNSSAVVYVKDRSGRFLYVNHQFAHIFNVTEKDILGQTVFDIFPREIAESFIETDQKVFNSKNPMEFEEIGIVNGEQHTYLSVKFPLFNNENEVYAVCGISTDITARKKTEDALRNVALGVAGATGDNVFEAMVWHLAETLEIDFAFLGRLSDDQKKMATIAVTDDGKFIQNIVYDLEGTPCQKVVGNDFYLVPDNVQQHYPKDSALTELNMESYAGFPLFDSHGNSLGILSIASRSPITDNNIIRSVMEIFSVRAAAELEKMAADEAQKVSEKSYRSIFDASEDAIFLLGLESGDILDVNHKACDTFGYSRSEFLELSIDELCADSDKLNLHQVHECIKKASSGEPQQVEWLRKNKEGSISWDEIFIKRAVIAGVDRILMISRDITEKKIAEQKLRAQEEQYRVIFNSSVDGLIVFDEFGQIIDVNPMFKIIHGYDAGFDFSQIQPEDIIPEDHLPMYQEYIHTVVTQGHMHIIGQGINQSGNRLMLDIHGVRMAHAERVQILTIVRDITEQNRAEEALRKSEDRLRATFEAALDAIISMDENGKVVEFNPAAETCFGYQREVVIGESLAELITPLRYREAHQKGIKRYLQTGEGNNIGKRIEITAMRANGEEFPAELAIDVTQGTEGKLFIGYMRDITERKNAEDSRDRLEAQLRQAQKMEAIGHLTGGIAHDFNNILTSILGYVVMAEEKTERLQDAKISKYLSRAKNSGKKARDLIQQMLTFSRGQRGEPRVMPLGPLVKESMKLLEISLPSSVEIELDVDNSCSQIMIDPVHLEQVLMNLCINARDAVHNNGCIRISVKQHECVECNCDACRQPFSGSFVELSVEDNGCGITPEVIERMFEPFFSTKEVGKGSGMGLSTVHGIVHEYGGHIKIETELNKGTNIHVMFRSLADKSVNEIQSTDELNPQAGHHRKLTGRVLVVDDEEDVAEFMLDMLEDWGLEVTVITNSVIARDVFRQNSDKFDLVITDFTMPKLTGIQLANEIRQTNHSVPIILYTGFSEDLQQSELQSAGISYFLTKPIDVDETFNHVNALLS